jgi:hypothetical protein
LSGDEVVVLDSCHNQVGGGTCNKIHVTLKAEQLKIGSPTHNTTQYNTTQQKHISESNAKQK